MFDAGSAASKLGLDLSEYTRGMLEATSLAQVFPQTVTTFIANPLLGVVDVAGKAGGALVGMISSWMDAVGAFANRADDIGDKAASLGVSPEFLSGVGAAFKDAGSSVEGFGDALGFLNDKAAAAAQGDKTAVDSFSRIGVSADQVTKNLGNTEAMFRLVADGIGKLPTAAERSSAATDLMGRQMRTTAGVFAEGMKGLDDYADTIRRTGGIVTEQDAAMGDSATKLASFVDSAFEGIERAAARPVLRLLQEHFGSTKEGIAQSAEAIDRVVEQLVQSLIDGLKEAARSWGADGLTLQDVLDGVRTTARVAGEAMKLAFDVASMSILPLVAQVRELNELLAPVGGIAGGLPALGGGITAPLLGAAEIMRSNAQAATPSVSAGGDFGPVNVTVVSDPNATADALARQIAPQIRAAQNRTRQQLMSQNWAANILLGS